MPILDDIRRSQIYEAMNYDRTMYAKAFGLVKQAVGKMGPDQELEPYQQLNQEDIDASKELVDQFLELLDE